MSDIADIEARLKAIEAGQSHYSPDSHVAKDLRTLLDALATVTAERSNLEAALRGVHGITFEDGYEVNVAALIQDRDKFERNWRSVQHNEQYLRERLEIEKDARKAAEARAEAMARAVREWQEAKRDWIENMNVSRERRLGRAEAALLALQTDPTE